MMPTNEASEPASRARTLHRLAVLTALATVPLVLFGGSVTTLGAGMAVEGWIIAEGHFLPLFPVEKWFRDVGTMVEHTHRLFGMLVGFLAIATVVAGVRAKRPGLPLVGLVAVCAQGALGGFRVLESSPELAFVHGACAQAVFALLVGIATVLSPRYASARAGAEAPRARLATVAWTTAALVYAQVVLGAWYRHGLRGGLELAEGEVAMRLALHLVGAGLVVFAILSLLGALRATLDGEEARDSEEARALVRAQRRLRRLLAVQVALGLFAWAARDAGIATIGLVEWITTILHVLCGGLLLAQTSVTALWATRSRTVRMPRTAAAGGVA